VQRYFYSDDIADFLAKDATSILGELAAVSSFALEPTQRDAWLAQITILAETLSALGSTGRIYFEYSIPRLGKRADVILIIGSVLFVIEFKVGERGYPAHAIDQVWDYALDLKNFHETSHDCVIAPILVATEARGQAPLIAPSQHEDLVLSPIACNSTTLCEAMRSVLIESATEEIDSQHWQQGRYAPTPTIIEAAMALYNGHSVEEIARHDAEAINLTQTTETIESTIAWARANSRKAICFVTGVPGAGKTLVGLNIATTHIDRDEALHSVFLSGNGPLVSILQEALARDKVRHERERDVKLTLKEARRQASTFIQNVHHFRDEYVKDTGAPFEHVTVFDEAQRAWNLEQTANFMRRKRDHTSFAVSEPEFLISCLDRHSDWAVIVCLVGGGQEINTGEAGISEWIDSVMRSFKDWHLFISSRLVDSEYAAGTAIEHVKSHPHVTFRDELHLAVSMRSFRAENVSTFVKLLLDLDANRAADLYHQLEDRYPIVITRDLRRAKDWLRRQARGSERYGIVVSSEAQRLKPHAIDVRTEVDPIHWFLDGKDDVRSSFYLEDVVTEFQVQGLELDWTCVTWDGDFRHTPDGWDHWSFKGSRWERIRKAERQMYQKNAYRVLLTRARQGMVIVVPEGSLDDPTRKGEFYDPTFDYLQSVGLPVLL
jgi:hypothetical protein